MTNASASSEAIESFSKLVHHGAVRVGSKSELAARAGVDLASVEMTTRGEVHKVERGVLVDILDALERELGIAPVVREFHEGLINTFKPA